MATDEQKITSTMEDPYANAEEALRRRKRAEVYLSDGLFGIGIGWAIVTVLRLRDIQTGMPGAVSSWLVHMIAVLLYVRIASERSMLVALFAAGLVGLVQVEQVAQLKILKYLISLVNVFSLLQLAIH